MTPERFGQLIEAYGADARLWPAAERTAAERFRADRPDLAGPLLAEADVVDALLHAAPRIRVSHDLRERALAAAAGAGLRARPALFRLDRLGWMLGAGWAAAACAGVVAGLTLTTHLTADAQADAVLYQASLAGVDDTELLASGSLG